MFVGMGWEIASNDEVETGLGQFFGLAAGALGAACDLLIEADRRQQFLADGSPGSGAVVVCPVWACVMPRRRSWCGWPAVLQDLPVLRERFAAGGLSLDQVDAISAMATAETEAALVEESLGLSNAALDRAARRSNSPSAADERTVWERRRLGLQWNLDASELRLNGNLPGVEGRIVEEAVRSRADRIGPNPTTGLFDDYTTRLADGLVQLAATSSSGDRAEPPVVMLTVNVDLEALHRNRFRWGRRTGSGTGPRQ